MQPRLRDYSSMGYFIDVFFQILFKISSFFNPFARNLFIKRHKRIKLKLKDIVTTHGFSRFTYGPALTDFSDRLVEQGKEFSTSTNYEDINRKYKQILKKSDNTNKEYVVETSTYPWAKLKRHIKWFGLINPLIVKEVITDDSHYTEPIKYVLHDGNHRYSILHELYGEDYEVKCKVLQIPSNLKINHVPSSTNKILYHSKVITDNPKVYETLNTINDLKVKMLKEDKERKMKLMQKYRMNVRVNQEN